MQAVSLASDLEDMQMRLLNLPVAVGLLFASTFAASALPAGPAGPIVSGETSILIANGCGGGRYRGPEGACHRFGRGPFPGGYDGPYRADWNGCRAGWYRGPGGACHRYGHGPYPGGYHGPYR